MIGKPHILSVTDVQRGIQALAAKLLGDASQWMQLVSANQLTPPYLTLNASEVYGPATADISLSSSLTSGANTISLSNQPLNISEVYLSYAGSSGLVAEAVGIESYDGQTITLDAALKNSYPQGARIQLFSSYVIQNAVLLPGDTILIPVQVQGFTLNNQQQLIDAFGSDLADPVSFASGDLATVSGVSTLLQRIRAALQTLLGSLPLQPQFGSRLAYAIGTPSTSVKWSALMSDALLRLPEVQSVANTSISVQGSTAYVSATVQVRTSDATLQLLNEAFSIAA